MPKLMAANFAYRRWLLRNGADGISELDQYRTAMWFFEEFAAGRQVDVWSEPGPADLSAEQIADYQELSAALRRGEVPEKYRDAAQTFFTLVGPPEGNA